MKPCIEWTGSRQPFGYGQVTHEGRTVLVHRLAWIRAYGEIPKGMCVLHHCDNPPCYNVEHLFLGTRRDNVIDRTRKGRGVCPTRRLTEEQVRDIRQRLAAGESNKVLAIEYGVDTSNISHIKHNRSWAGK